MTMSTAATCRMRRSTRQQLLFNLILLLLSYQIHPADAFATYLLTKIGCMTELSTDEVIMNHPVVAAADSDHPTVHLQIVAGSQKDSIVELQLVYDKEALKDVQFVMDVVTDDEEEEVAAKFRQGQCDHDKRMAGRGEDTVPLRFLLPNRCASVVAGWATGHEAVRLTPVLQVCPTQLQDNNAKVNDELAEQLQAYKNDVNIKDHPHKLEEEQPDKKSENSNSDHRKDAHHRPLKEKQMLSSGSISKSKDNNKSDNKSNKQFHKKHKPLKKIKRSGRTGLSRQQKKIKLSPGHRHHEFEEDDKVNDDKDAGIASSGRAKKLIQERQRTLLNKIQNNKKQPTGDMPIQLEMRRFVYGLGILILGTILAIQACKRIAAGDSSSNKGRLSL